MNIQTKKLELVKTILNIDIIEHFNKIADLIQKEKSDFWFELNIIQQGEIKQGIKELDSGKKVAYKTFFKKIPE